MSADNFHVSGQVDIPVVDNYQDKTFGSVDTNGDNQKLQSKTQKKVSRSSPISMFLTATLEKNDHAFDWDSDKSVLYAFSLFKKSK